MTRRPLPPPSRAYAVRRAIADARLEGQELSPETLALLQRYQDGEIDAAEMVRLGQEQVAAYIKRGRDPD